MDRRITRPLWRRPRTLVAAGSAVALAIVVVVGAGLATGARSSLRAPAASVTISNVAPGVFHDFVTLRAKVVPREVVYLDALEGGQIAQIMAQAGDVVAAGQPLVRFRNTQLELEVLDREARLSESITQLQAYEKQLEDARVNNDREAACRQHVDERIQREPVPPLDADECRAGQ